MHLEVGNLWPRDAANKCKARRAAGRTVTPVVTAKK